MTSDLPEIPIFLPFKLTEMPTTQGNSEQLRRVPRILFIKPTALALRLSDSMDRLSARIPAATRQRYHGSTLRRRLPPRSGALRHLPHDLRHDDGEY